MNRRGFFKSLAALAGAASASPLIFIPKFEPVKWKPVCVGKPIYVGQEEIIMQVKEFDRSLDTGDSFQMCFRITLEKLKAHGNRAPIPISS